MESRVLLPIFILLLLIACNTPTEQQLNSVSSGSDLNEKYQIEDVSITTRDGGTISAIVTRPASQVKPLPTAMQFTIYVRDQGRDLQTMTEAVDRGYIGVFAYTRGKRHSPDDIAPYEHDGSDAYDVIDWISKQAWSNGEVGMYGGSYNGFTQWAATKELHPALKTIVPYVANRPGMGLPMENGIFINPNYQWTFYVTNNKFLDNDVNNDRQRFRDMQNKWWSSGKAYRELDAIDGQKNPWFQRWLEHPSYDAYWQQMVPYENEFEQVKIPVLSIDGYYNDSQNSGLYYLREHIKYLPSAEHYLLIGPYGHFGAQQGGQTELNGLKIPAEALFDIKALTFDWFDYIFKKAPRPAILKDRINYQVMGTDEWKSAKSISAMSDSTLTFHLATQGKSPKEFYQLDAIAPTSETFLTQVVDYSDRDIWNNDYYPEPIIKSSIDTSSGFIFMTNPLDKEILFNGSFSGEFVIKINKRDVDLGISLYELMPDGNYFQLSYYVGRASYAKDITKRQLLTPNTLETVPFSNTRMISKKLSKGSRLVAYINVNKNPFSQLNYGTGKDVSDETVTDANEKLVIKWYSQSELRIPVLSIN